MDFIPFSTALATATTIPRSLKEPVGLHPSSLKNNDLHPTSCTIFCDSTNGVFPSPREKIGVSEVMGRNFL